MALHTDQLHLSFNQDGTCLCVADAQGVGVYALKGDRFQPIFSLPVGGVGVGELLFRTSLLAYVGAGHQPHLSPRRLTLYNSHKEAVIQHLSYPSSVLGVLLNRKRVCVLLERRSYVYDLGSLELQQTLDVERSRGVGALTPCSEPSLLAVPAPADGGRGVVRVHDLLAGGGRVLAEFEAHRSPLALLAWNDDGSLLASASEKGTVVRLHRMPHATRAHEFRRGTSGARITSLAFTPSSAPLPLLCVASTHGTIHIFSLQEVERHRALEMASSVLTSILPTKVVRAVQPARHITTVRLPCSGQPVICAVLPQAEGDARSAGEGKGACLRLAVATGEAELYRYRVEGLATASCTCSLEEQASVSSTASAAAAAAGGGAGDPPGERPPRLSQT